MKKSKIAIMLIIMILILILIVVAIILIKNKDNGDNIEMGRVDVNEDNFGQDHNIYVEDNASEFFSVATSIRTYLNSIALKDSKAVYNLLDKEYINKFSITEENVLENVIRIENRQIFQGKQMYHSDSFYHTTYFVYGTIREDIMDEITEEKDFYIIVEIDMENWTFSVTPNVKENVNNIQALYSDYDINREVKEIEKNESNSYKYLDIKDSTIADTYLNNYKNDLLSNIERAYNSLDKEYREKRFSSLDEFKKYVENNIEVIMNNSLNQYGKVERNGYTQYVCTDTNDAYYIFNETSVMQYSVILDAYTIDFPEFIEKYNGTTNQGKTALNIQKIVDSINAKDYKYAYSKLSDGFKKENFPTIESFETYIKSTLYNKNKVEYVIFSEESGLCTYKIKLINAEDEQANVVEKTIIMELRRRKRVCNVI